MDLLSVLGRLLGVPVRRPSTRIATAAARLPEEAEELAGTSRAMTREPAEPAPRGRALAGITTDDLDPATGRLHPDYLERRARREAGRKAKDEDMVAGVVDRDLRPL